MPFERMGSEVVYRDPRGGGLVKVRGYDPNTGTIKWQSEFGVHGSTKLQPGESEQFAQISGTGSNNPSQGGGQLVGPGINVTMPGGVSLAQSASDQAVQDQKFGSSNLDANDVTLRMLDEFIAELKNPINADSNDPYVQGILRGVTSQSTLQSAGRGIEGGLSMAATQQNIGSALGQLEGQRKDRLQSALGLRSQHGLSTEQLANQARGLAEQQYQFDSQMGMAGQGQSGLGAGLGGIAGLALPLVGSALFPQYSAEIFKNLPNFMQGGVAAGQGFESSLAGPYRPQPRSSSKRGGYRGA